jgi:hypothetical protein
MFMLAGLLACSSPPPKKFDDEVLLDLAIANQRQMAAVWVTLNRRTGPSAMVSPETNQVRVRVAGGPVTEIWLHVRTPSGLECETKVTLKGPGPYTIELECPAPAPVADAGAPADATPDATPDLSPDTMPPDAIPAVCERYCAAMRDHCPGVYPTGQQECLTACTAFGWPMGMPGDQGGDSVECRITSALQAPTIDDPNYCVAAGPSGGDRCGSLCGNYCSIAARSCPYLIPGGTRSECVSTLCDRPPLPFPSMPALHPDHGDNIECRIFWLGQAVADHGMSCARLREDAQDPACHN